MSVNDDLTESVGQHYDENVSLEVDRLPKRCPVELAITARLIHRWIPPGSTVGEVGVGGGHYTEILAGLGCRLYLADVSRRLLDRAVASLADRGLSGQVVSAEIASASYLHTVSTGALDALLLLGPLYHLCTAEMRKKAIAEATRVLKPGGVLFAAGINRLSYLRDLFREAPEKVVGRREFHERYLRDGNLDPDHAPPIGFSHMTTRGEFRELFPAGYEELDFLAAESFTTCWQERLLALPPEAAAAWLDLVEETARTPEAFGMADHYLFVGRKR